MITSYTSVITAAYSIVWFAIGFLFFIFWWSRRHNIEKDDIVRAVVSGSIGVFSWPLGWMIHFEHVLVGDLKQKRSAELPTQRQLWVCSAGYSLCIGGLIGIIVSAYAEHAEGNDIARLVCLGLFATGVSLCVKHFYSLWTTAPFVPIKA